MRPCPPTPSADSTIRPLRSTVSTSYIPGPNVIARASAPLSALTTTSDVRAAPTPRNAVYAISCDGRYTARTQSPAQCVTCRAAPPTAGISQICHFESRCFCPANSSLLPSNETCGSATAKNSGVSTTGACLTTAPAVRAGLRTSWLPCGYLCDNSPATTTEARTKAIAPCAWVGGAMTLVDESCIAPAGSLTAHRARARPVSTPLHANFMSAFAPAGYPAGAPAFYLQ